MHLETESAYLSAFSLLPINKKLFETIRDSENQLANWFNCQACHRKLTDSFWHFIYHLQTAVIRTDMHHCRYCSSPACVNCASAISLHDLLAAGLAGLGCIMTAMSTSVTAASRSAVWARHCAYLPTATIVRIHSSRTTSTRARSHAVFSWRLTSAGSSGGVKFLPLRHMNRSGHMLCTKQCRKKFSGVMHNCWNSFQNRAPLTWQTHAHKLGQTLVIS